MANIYVIDDDEQLLRMVGMMLKKAGHTTKLIPSPQKGIEKNTVCLDILRLGEFCISACNYNRYISDLL